MLFWVHKMLLSPYCQSSIQVVKKTSMVEDVEINSCCRRWCWKHMNRNRLWRLTSFCFPPLHRYGFSHFCSNCCEISIYIWTIIHHIFILQTTSLLKKNYMPIFDCHIFWLIKSRTLSTNQPTAAFLSCVMLFLTQALLERITVVSPLTDSDWQCVN